MLLEGHRWMPQELFSERMVDEIVEGGSDAVLKRALALADKRSDDAKTGVYGLIKVFVLYMAFTMEEFMVINLFLFRKGCIEMFWRRRNSTRGSFRPQKICRLLVLAFEVHCYVTVIYCNFAIIDDHLCVASRNLLVRDTSWLMQALVPPYSHNCLFFWILDFILLKIWSMIKKDHYFHCPIINRFQYLEGKETRCSSNACHSTSLSPGMIMVQMSWRKIGWCSS